MVKQQKADFPQIFILFLTVRKYNPYTNLLNKSEKWLGFLFFFLENFNPLFLASVSSLKSFCDASSGSLSPICCFSFWTLEKSHH